MYPSFVDRLDELKPFGIEKQVSEGSTFRYQSETVQTLSIVLRGTLRAYNVTSNGTQIWIDDFSLGDIVGSEMLGENKQSQFDVTALSNVVLLNFSEQSFSDLSLRDLSLSLYILQKLSDQIATRTARMIDGLALSSFGRICSELKRQSKPSGISPGLHVIRPKPIFSEFALRIGTTRETVSRTVSKLAGKGIIVREPGALLIPEMIRLDDLII